MDDWLERHWRVSPPELRTRVRELLALVGGDEHENSALYQDLLWSVLRLVQEDVERWDAKIAAHTLREMERAFALLRRYRRRRKVTIFGSSHMPATAPDFASARVMGRLLAEDGFMVITGAGGGIMEAAHAGAGLENSIGFNIQLPRAQEVNAVMDGNPRLMEFRFFFTRKLFFVKEADALVVFPGGFGTLDETFELLTLVQTGKSPLVPIVLMDGAGEGYWQRWREFVETQIVRCGYASPDDLRLVSFSSDPQQAREVIRRFYHNFHSSRWVGEELRLRLHRPVPAEVLPELAREFADICDGRGFEQVPPHEEEADEPELQRLARLALRFNSREPGRLRELIDRLNAY
jgi:hypothetical protein